MSTPETPEKKHPPALLQMYVIKRNGNRAPVDFEKVNRRLTALAKYPTQLYVNASFVAQQTVAQIVQDVKTTVLDEHAANIAIGMSEIHADFQRLAARIAISNHQKNTAKNGDSFSGAMEVAYRNVTANGTKAPRINAKLYKFVQQHKQALNQMIDYSRDFRFSYFGFTTLLDRYLLKRSGPRDLVAARPQDYVVERPQDAWLRCACALFMNRKVLHDTTCLPTIKLMYDLFSLGKMTLATPTIANLGTQSENLLSCFLTAGGDSIDEPGGIFDLVKNTGTISKGAGGVAFWWDLRHIGAEVKGTGGVSNGMESFLAIMGSTALAVDQGGKRKGSFAHYLEPIHPHFPKWCVHKRQVGTPLGALFYGAWIPDLFMEALEKDLDWYFFDPVDYPEIYQAYGDKFRELYNKGVATGKTYGSPMKARSIWKLLLDTQIETGVPYIMFKDACNLKSNQRNLGVIKSSNLCTEIVQVSTPQKYSCCCVASMCLPEYARVEHTDCKHEADEPHVASCTRKFTFDYLKLASDTGLMVLALNQVIDINAYPVKETAANVETRPLGIGEQGLADVFMMMRVPFTSQPARAVNKIISESLYFGALRTSCDLAKTHGPYVGFAGSPLSQGEFQWDMWKVEEKDLCGLFDWAQLRKDIMQHGVYNSLLISLPPTASTSHIQGNNECFEPYTGMIYNRKTLSGTFTIINHHMVRHMTELGMWDKKMQEDILKGENGSIQHITRLPQEFRDVYRTVWEYKTKDLIDMSRDRAPFVDQSMSDNRWIKAPTFAKLTSMHFYAWRKGLKTGCYYVHSMSKSKPTVFNVDAADAIVAAAATTNIDIKFLSQDRVAVCTDGECCKG